MIAFAKTRPGQLTAGSAGNGTASHLAVELLNMMGGIKTTHVPYKGLAPAHTELMGGQLSLLFDGIVTGMPAVKAGRLRALAVTTVKRWQGTPDIPTMAEAGLAGFEAHQFAASIWYASYPCYYQNYILAAMTATQLQEALTNKFGDEKISDPEVAPWMIEHLYAGGETIEWTERIRNATGKNLETGAYLRKLGIETAPIITRHD